MTGYFKLCIESPEVTEEASSKVEISSTGSNFFLGSPNRPSWIGAHLSSWITTYQNVIVTDDQNNPN